MPAWPTTALTGLSGLHHSAPPRLCVKEPDAPSHAAIPMQQKFFWVGTHHRDVRSVWPCNCYCAVARGALGRGSFCDRGGRAPLGGLARGQLGRSALKVGGACQGLFSTRSVPRRSRARKSAGNKIQADRLGKVRAAPAHNGLRALPTLCVSAAKDWRRSFWSAVLQHRFRFG